MDHYKISLGEGDLYSFEGFAFAPKPQDLYFCTNNTGYPCYYADEGDLPILLHCYGTNQAACSEGLKTFGAQAGVEL